jgi:hypothetical protein
VTHTVLRHANLAWRASVRRKEIATFLTKQALSVGGPYVYSPVIGTNTRVARESDMTDDHRLVKLEADVQHLQSDVTEIKADVGMDGGTGIGPISPPLNVGGKRLEPRSMYLKKAHHPPASSWDRSQFERDYTHDRRRYYPGTKCCYLASLNESYPE